MFANIQKPTSMLEYMSIELLFYIMLKQICHFLKYQTSKRDLEIRIWEY